eukprot:14292820-Heterocapsa_arctica.AAC.1
MVRPRRHQTEVKHGRAAMLAAMSRYLKIIDMLPGYLSPPPGLNAADPLPLPRPGPKGSPTGRSGNEKG